MANEVSPVKALPKWLQYRYAILWKAHKSKSFSQEAAEKDLGMPRATVRVILSEIRKAGWMTIEFEATDIRKFRYILKSPQAICESMEYSPKEMMVGV